MREGIAERDDTYFDVVISHLAAAAFPTQEGSCTFGLHVLAMQAGETRCLVAMFGEETKITYTSVNDPALRGWT